jgi:hypothetical protein
MLVKTERRRLFKVIHYLNALTTALLCQFASHSAWSDIQQTAQTTAPLPVQNMYPPMLRFYDPLPSSALQAYSESLGIELLQTYSSIYEFDALPDGKLLVDMELYSLNLKLTRAFTSKTELALTVPLYYAYDGFMDSFLRDYHSTFGFPNGGRELRPDDEFVYFYNDPDGSESWQGQEGWEVGNLAISLRHHLISGEGWSAALLGGITLPTGSRKRGWGTGKPDIAIGGVVSWLSSNWFGHVEGHLLHPFATGSTATAYRDYARLSSTLGYRLSDRWSLMAQVQGGSSPYDTSLQQLDDTPWLVTFGARVAYSKASSLTLAFTEDITHETTTDFTVTVGLKFDL